MAIAQMNLGQLKEPLAAPSMSEFNAQLENIYQLAEASDGFIWRIDDEQIAHEILECGLSDLTSATVSVWDSVEHLRSYTFDTAHGIYLNRAKEWFNEISKPQLVIWDVTEAAKPSFIEAYNRLEHLRKFGPSDYAFGWNHLN